MNSLDLKKKELLNLKKSSLSTYDKLKSRRIEKEKEISTDIVRFVEEVIIPQVLEYNSIGFTKKEFLCVDSLGKFAYSNYHSDILEHKSTISKALIQNGFDVTFEYLFDFLNRGNIRILFIVDWSKILFNKENTDISEVEKKIKEQHNGFNTHRYSLIEKFVNENILKEIQLKNEENIVSIDYKGNNDLHSVFDKLIVIEILKKHGIYAKLNDDFHRLTIKWEKPLDEYYKESCTYDAKYCQDICDKLLSKAYLVDKTSDFYVEIYRKLSNTEEEKFRYRLSMYKDVEFNNIVRPTKYIKLTNFECKTDNTTLKNTILEYEDLDEKSMFSLTEKIVFILSIWVLAVFIFFFIKF